MKRTVTSREVARKCGVSQTAVSLVLNGRGDEHRISADTQRKILDVAEELGYRSNFLARGLKGASTQSVGLIWSITGSPQAAQVVSELATRIGRRNYVCYVMDSRGSTDATASALHDLAQRRVDAVIAQINGDVAHQPAIATQLQAMPAAVLVSDRQLDVPYDVVSQDRLSAYRAAAQHFVDIGKKRPEMFGTVGHENAKANAFYAQLKQAGVTVANNPGIDIAGYQGDTISQRSYAALDAQFPDRPTFDALMCTTDEIAIAAMAWCRDRGLRVPEDVAIVGFDDTPIAAFQAPPLASVRRLDEQAVDIIEEMLFARLANPDAPRQTQHLTMQFEPRASAG